MAEGLNEVTLCGNLGADPELRSTNGGDSVLRLRLATAESYRDRNNQWQERTEWHSVIVWGKRAEALHQILVKGRQILVKGSLRTSSYDDKDGIKRYKTEINAKQVILCGGSGSRPASQGGQGSSSGQPRSGSNGSSDQQQGDGGDQGGYGYGQDDDIPF